MKNKKVLFAIRDDDTSYFTKPSELLSAYDFVKTGSISLSIVPMTYSNHLDVFPYGKMKEGYFDISNNAELVGFIKCNNKFDVLQHGYSHEYKVINGTKTAEMIWKTGEQLSAEIEKGKEKLESLFDRRITVFVSPSNKIDSKGISIIEKNGMHFSGIISSRIDRVISPRYLFNYVKRWTFRLFHGFAYPGCIRFKNHIEIYANPLLSFLRLKKIFDYCKRKNHPFVIYTHYWYLNDNPDEKQKLIEIYNYAIENGAALEPLSEIFDKALNHEIK